MPDENGAKKLHDLRDPFRKKIACVGFAQSNVRPVGMNFDKRGTAALAAILHKRVVGCRAGEQHGPDVGDLHGAACGWS
ncbi:MAG: hypothetical protein ABGZ17_20715, partial [Planctomycetaceae bacterium]